MSLCFTIQLQSNAGHLPLLPSNFRIPMFARPAYTACLGQTQQAAFKFAFRNAATRNARAAPLKRGIAASARANFQQQSQSRSPSTVLLAVAAGSTIAFWHSSPIRCDVTTSAARPYAESHTPSVQGPGSARLTRANEPPAVESSVDLRSLSFGAVAGISTGLFVKKGLKAAGFLLGGIFVLLQVRQFFCDLGSELTAALPQYLATRGMVNVDWKSMASRYERTVDTLAGAGTGTRLQRVGSRVLDFLMADFPPRASFAAGFVLGVRMG